MQNTINIFAVLMLCGLFSAPAACAEVQKRVSDPVFQGDVHYHESGPKDAPTVLLVHGLGDKAARDWDGLTADLARDYRVVRFDLPGFGRSSKGNLAYTPERYVQFLHALVNREVRARPFFLVGHSMGGAIALRYAALYPQDVTALVLVDVPAILHRYVYSKHLAAFGLNRMVPGLYPNGNDMLGNMLGNVLGNAEKKALPVDMVVQVPALRQKLLRGEPSLISGLALALEDFGRDIARVTAPTLLLWGELDETAPIRSGRVLAANLAHARLDTFPGAGHVPMDDVPQQFQARVREFLRDPAIPDQAGVLRDAAALPDSARRGRCEGKRNQVFEGDFDRIDVERCENVALRRVRARQVVLRSSVVTIEDSRIGGGAEGLVVDSARVTITSSRIEGITAIVANNAKLDIAGSRIIGQGAAITTGTTSEAAFSVSQVESRYHYGPLHGLRFIVPESPL